MSNINTHTDQIFQTKIYTVISAIFGTCCIVSSAINIIINIVNIINMVMISKSGCAINSGNQIGDRWRFLDPDLQQVEQRNLQQPGLEEDDEGDDDGDDEDDDDDDDDDNDG